MKIIEIAVGNKKYKISCNPGEEDKILQFSKNIDQKYKDLSDNLGDKASENLILVIIGLMLEDEIASLKDKNFPKDSYQKEKITKLTNKVDSVLKRLEDLKVSL